jgi:hypothetical protein
MFKPSERDDSKQRARSTKLNNFAICNGDERNVVVISLESLDGRGVCLNCPLLVQRSILFVRLLLDLVHVQVGDLSILSIEDLGEFLESWASGLNVEEVDECEFDEDPDGVECDEAVLRVNVGPRDWVGLVAENQCSLDGQVHDHESLGSELVWENLERVCDQKTGPCERVEDTEEPDESNLGVTCSPHRCVAALLKLRSSDSPCQKHQAHSCGRGQEEWSSSYAVNEESTANTNKQTEQCLASVQL